MSATLTAEARARLDAHLEAIEKQLEAAGKNREERRAIVDDVETQALEMLRAGGGSLRDVEAVLAKMDRPESFGPARKVEKRKSVLWIIRIAFLMAGCGPLGATAMETLGLHIFRSMPVVDNSGLPHDASDMDPGPDHIDVVVKTPDVKGLHGDTWTERMPLPQRDTRGLHRLWGAYVGWMIAFGIMMPWVVIAAVLAIIGWRRAQFAIEHVMAAMTVLICALVVWHMVVAMGRG